MSLTETTPVSTTKSNFPIPLPSQAEPVIFFNDGSVTDFSNCPTVTRTKMKAKIGHGDLDKEKNKTKRT